MKPILVQQNSNGALWWVVDWKISVRTPSVLNMLKCEPSRHKVYTLIPADNSHRGSRIDYAEYYTYLSNCK